MERTPQSIPDLKRELAARAEQVCTRYLSQGEKSGTYWRVGDIANTPGRSMFVALTGPSAGQWADPSEGTHGDLLDIILHHEGEDFGRACRAARILIGTEHVAPATPRSADNPYLESARRNFTAAMSLRGSHAARYLETRGIIVPDAPQSLRFNPSLPYRTRLGWEHYPALIAAVTDHDGTFHAIQRTYLAHETPTKADIEDPRRTLGHIAGGAIRIGDTEDIIAVGEGLETMLSLRTAFPRLPIAATTGTQILTGWTPAPRHRRILIASDSDDAGRTAAEALAERLRSEQLDVALAVPLEGDFNDELLEVGATELRRRLVPTVRSLAR